MGFFRKLGNFVTGGALDRKDARYLERRAKEKMDDANRELEISKIDTQENLEELGNMKIDIYNGSIKEFVKVYEIIGKVDLTPLKKDTSLNYSNFKRDIKEMKSISISLQDVATSIGGGAVTGTAAAMGAMGMVGLIGTASTGTAIGTLSGVAATNATLAWLGGGAISAGGAGMAGGMVVLGGIALAPIAIFGAFIGMNKGKEALNEARNYYYEMNVLIEKVRTLISELSQIRRASDLMKGTLKPLDFCLSNYTFEMSKIVDRLENRSTLHKKFIDPIKKFFNISILTNEEAQIFADSANVASLLSDIMKKPLINEEGAFESNTLEFLESNQNLVIEAENKLKRIA